ncbi:MAG: DUF4355 domain-containing protein [Ruminococcaceae bacterium]|nr:DUF4355 domain-containing protein [Oscillospiraceae bacterium]
MTEEEKQELETLRLEKHQREQTHRAREALERAGIPASFAPLLIGADDGDTDQRAEQFRSAYQEALAGDIRSRLPQQPPVVTAPAPQRPRRGIQRIR